MTDAIQAFKQKQREQWASFAPLELITTPTAARLVRFAGVRRGQKVLDVACGTGVVALTARREGAHVTALDLTPELLARAKEHSALPGFEDIVWREGDAEVMPFADGEFDVVLSQYGHMFAPRADVVMKEMLRVLKPGGTIAFSTWPPEHAIGSIFATVGKFRGPPPPGISPTPQWGDVSIVRQRLGDTVRDVAFDRGTMIWPTVSPSHYFELLEKTSGPVLELVKTLRAEPAKLEQFRREIEAIVARYFDPTRNEVHQDYLMTRAVKA
ncbi:MAG TPA: methyltransferase domain-containing protein [Candidatus Thermoplasmatota archaeon]|nr:methyltransferase domain-containing protein [Candidatus Thermoplasmatota archaeon]